MTTTAYERVVDAFRNQGLIVQEKTAGVADCQAPGHSPRDRSVRVTATEGQVLIYSHSDPTEEVLDRLGIKKSDLFDNPKGVVYDYDDGRRVGRTPDKRFYQSGNTQGSALYRAAKLPDAIAEGRTIYVTEGEKDVHALEAAGAVACCTAMGAGNAAKFDFTPLRGGTVVLVSDNDDDGIRYARTVAGKLLALDCQVSIVNAKVGKDAADHIAAGFRLDEWIPRTDLEAEAKLDDLLARVEKMRESNDAQTTADFLASKLVTVHTTSSRNDGLGQLTHVDELLDDWWAWMDTDEADIRRIPTPWWRVNDVIAGGLQPKRLYLAAARPGFGKSLLLTNVAQHAATSGHKVALYSLEMDKSEILGRIMAAGADASASQITRREVDDYNRDKLATYTGIIQGASLWVSDQAPLTVAQIRSQCMALKEQHGLDLICVDYAQLLTSTAKGSENEQLTQISKALKQLAMELNVAVLSAAQINREAVRENRKPRAADLRGSGSLEQDSDVVILIHHEEQDGMPTGMAQMIFDKNRTGSKTTVEEAWRPNHSKFGEWTAN